MTWTKCLKCGWTAGAGDHEAQALLRAEQIGGFSARRHIKQAAKDDRRRAAWNRILRRG